MKKSNVSVLCWTMVMMIGMGWLFAIDSSNITDSLRILLTIGGNVETIDCFADETGSMYFFLPSGVETSDVIIDLKENQSVYIDGRKLTDGMMCDEYDINEKYAMEHEKFGTDTKATIAFLRSGNVASVYIETEFGNKKQLHNNKENREGGRVCIYQSDGSLNYEGILASIGGRGNSTWSDSDKKPYNIKLKEEASLLGMGDAEEWILLANSMDPSNIRNKLGYDLAEAVGMKYTSDSEWVDLYLNGEYVGLYLLCEKNEIHPERIAIPAEGSFLVSLEQETRLKSQDLPHVITKGNQALRIRYPSEPSKETIDKLASYWQQVENALLSDDGIDPITDKSWLDLIDLDSWAKKYLIEEILGNWDGCYISQYFYCEGYEEDAKVYAGPVWDYDRTLGNTSWQFQEPNILFANRYRVKGEYTTPWFHSLYKKEEFIECVIHMYQNEFLPALNYLRNEKIEEYAETIESAYEMDCVRWKNAEELELQVEFIHSQISNRIEFLSSLWVEERTYHIVQADPGFNQFVAYYAVEQGECLTNLKDLTGDSTSKFLGWYYADSDVPFDVAQPINEDIELYAKWYGLPLWWGEMLVEAVPEVIITVAFFALLALDFKRIRSIG